MRRPTLTLDKPSARFIGYKPSVKLLRILLLVLVSLAVPAYGWAVVRPDLPCPIDMGAANVASQPEQALDSKAAHDHVAQAAQSAQAAESAKCPHGMDCCSEADLVGQTCKPGQDCHPAAMMAPVTDAKVRAPITHRGVVAHVWLGNEGTQPPALWRPPRHT